MEQENEAYDEEGTGPPQPDLLRSYLAFGYRAIETRRTIAAVVFVVAASLVVAVAILWPKTFHCEMKLMSQRSSVLGDQVNANPLTEASDVIGRHENMVALVKQTDLIRNWELRRPALLKFKDRLLESMRGKPTDEETEAALVNYAQSRIFATVAENTLTIGADWPDSQMSADLVEGAHQVFMESRHAAEISTIQEKISILEGHAGKLRGEIDRVAEQLQHAREQRLVEANKAVRDAREGDAPAAGAAPVAARPRPRAAAEPDEQVGILKEEIETKKRAMNDLEADRNRRLVEAQAKLSELRSKYTPAHPVIRELEQNIASLTPQSPRAAALQAEVQSLESAVKERAALARSESSGGGGGAVAAGPAVGPGAAADTEALSAQVTKLLDGGTGIDPAITAQLQSTLAKYAALRDAIGTARIDLDTAQAAFNYRYKVIVPAEAPSKPSKPKVPLVIGGGLLAALLLALLIPVLVELRKGIITERWQVYRMELPILADLKYPPGSSE